MRVGLCGGGDEAGRNAILALGAAGGAVGLIDLNDNGALTSGFGTDGLRHDPTWLFDCGGSEWAGALCRVSDGPFVVAGSSDQRLAPAKFDDGALPHICW